MSQHLESLAAPGPPERPGASGGGPRPPRRPRWVWIVLVGVVAAVLVSCLVAVLLVPVLTRGIPDAFFRPSVTYTPEQGPPNPALLDSRPEHIVQRYLADYIGLAGTYPCVQDPSQYGNSEDPVLKGQPCPITRPVASYAVTSVTIRSHGLVGRPEAIVSILITYTTGQQWASAVYLAPDRYQHLVLIYLHLDCWSSFETLEMFGYLVPDIPPGAAYSSRDGLTFYCKPSSA